MSKKDLQLETIKKDFLSKVEAFMDSYYEGLVTGDYQLVMDASKRINDQTFVLIDSLVAHSGLKEHIQCH